MKQAMKTPSLVDTVVNIVPVNPFSAMAQGNILPIIFCCLLSGIGVAYLKESEDERIRNATTTLDMGRTATNVTGDLAVTCIVAKSEKEMDMSLWQDGKSAETPSKGAS